MDDCTSTNSLVKLDTALIKNRDCGVDGTRETRERDWALEKRMKELLVATRGLLLHLPGSCRFNNGSSIEDDDWNTYVRAKRSIHARFNQELSFEKGDIIRVLVSAEDMWSRGMWWPGELHGKKGLFATEHIESFNQKNYNSLCEFLEEEFKGEQLTALQTLAVRQVESVPDPAGMLWECVQCPQLTELDLKGCHLVELCDELQFWAVPHLKVLNLSNTQLPYLPASVGRLKHLHSLLLSGNALTTLPATLSFCSSLSTLDLQNNNFSILPAVIFRIESLMQLRRHGNYDMRRAIADLAASTRREKKYVTVVQERIPLLSAREDRRVVPLKLLAVRAVMTERLDYWANDEVAPALCRVLDISQIEYKICDNCCSAQPMDMRGFRIRWLVESYLGLKHVPFEHFACTTDCAHRLNDSFEKIQSRLKQQHDQEYQNMLDQYADTDAGTRTRHRSFLRKKRKSLEVREMWLSTDGRMRTWNMGTRQTATVHSRHAHYHHHHHHHRHHGSSGRSRASCSLM